MICEPEECAAAIIASIAITSTRLSVPTTRVEDSVKATLRPKPSARESFAALVR